MGALDEGDDFEAWDAVPPIPGPTETDEPIYGGCDELITLEELYAAGPPFAISSEIELPTFVWSPALAEKLISNQARKQLTIAFAISAVFITETYSQRDPGYG
jgi:hypothetical protein